MSSVPYHLNYSLSSRHQFTFASNSPIPLFLTLHGTDTTALDMLASAPNVRLLRTIAIGSGAAEERGARRSNNTFVSSVASAAFWSHDDADAAPNGLGAAAGDVSGPGTRTLRGELFVPKGSKQSFTFPRFACSVSFPPFLPCRNLPSRNEQTTTVFHCLSAPRFGWFHPDNCARGSLSNRTRHHNDGERTGRHSKLANATQLRGPDRELQRSSWLP